MQFSLIKSNPLELFFSCFTQCKLATVISQGMTVNKEQVNQNHIFEVLHNPFLLCFCHYLWTDQTLCNKLVLFSAPFRVPPPLCDGHQESGWFTNVTEQVWNQCSVYEHLFVQLNARNSHSVQNTDVLWNGGLHESVPSALVYRHGGVYRNNIITS